MKPFILCLDNDAIVKELDTIIDYKHKLERIYPLPVEDKLFFWKYAYINHRGMRIDLFIFDLNPVEKFEFLVTIHMCISRDNILKYILDKYRDKISENDLLVYAKEATISMIMDKDYYKSIYNVYPVDYNHPIAQDHLYVDHVINPSKLTEG